MSRRRSFKQVDVFTPTPFLGNPLAVVLDAEGLSSQQMQAIARWTNLSETTFVLPPTDPAADYQVRIFAPDAEFPFAGHPTLGTAHALLEAGLKPKITGRLTQQCGIGLVEIALAEDGSLSFQSPPARLEPVDDGLRTLISAALVDAVLSGTGAVIADMGIRWLLIPMTTAEACLAASPSFQEILTLTQHGKVNGLAIYAPHTPGGPADYEVRALLAEYGSLVEDPVTGSANACIARYLQTQQQHDYRVRQGTCVGRDGRLTVTYRDGHPWIGGHTLTIVDGTFAAD